MPIQTEIFELLKCGPMPSEEIAEVAIVEKYERLINQIQAPLSDDDVSALLSIFGSDSFFGLAWTLVSLIETAPGWISAVCLAESENEWLLLLKDRARRRIQSIS